MDSLSSTKPTERSSKKVTANGEELVNYKECLACVEAEPLHMITWKGRMKYTLYNMGNVNHRYRYESTATFFFFDQV